MTEGNTSPDAQETQLLAVVAAVAEREGISDHALRKRLGIAMSELNRLLTLLGDDVRIGGLGLIEAQQEATQKDAVRRTLYLSEKGRALCRR
ncbi:hypothetical protein [Niveibacterium sp. SC-1]|uniref:hypothetical protein n=1 Tax=Niveibacterium sp. SC-1 TaxID=3135646 RepID=UPI00311DF803